MLIDDEVRGLAELEVGPLVTVEALRGGRGAAYRVVGATEAVVKVFADLGAWQREVTARDVFGGVVRVPTVLLARVTESGLGVLVMEHVQAPSLAVGLMAGASFPRARAFGEAGESLSRIHEGGGRATPEQCGHFPVDELVALGLGRNQFYDSWSRLVTPVEGLYGRERLATVLAVVRRNASLLSQAVGARGIIHGDFQPKNLLCTDDGSLSAIVDWELSRSGFFVNDLAMLLRFVDTVPVERAVLDSYGVKGDGSDLVRMARLYDLVKVTLGLSKPGAPSSDIPRWVDFVDGCVEALVSGDSTLLHRSAHRLARYELR